VQMIWGERRGFVALSALLNDTNGAPHVASF